MGSSRELHALTVPRLTFTPPSQQPLLDSRPPGPGAPPETTLGPLTHPDDRINISRRPTATTTPHTGGMEDQI